MLSPRIFSQIKWLLVIEPLTRAHNPSLRASAARHSSAPLPRGCSARNTSITAVRGSTRDTSHCRLRGVASASLRFSFRTTPSWVLCAQYIYYGRAGFCPGYKPLSPSWCRSRKLAVLLPHHSLVGALRAIHPLRPCGVLPWIQAIVALAVSLHASLRSQVA
ncbi:hypothetical protein EXIGLDRAFT_736258 [Exidia glandulosa HHB12029]|uniref:Uncharacterized protein n=1 Tax=Exidia glandulosa HHB12029 TaxID=1314781 RepID=A0A165JH65_EXIGL|nr:hypothetical protein EXIGLDRAFT_736258 [Exidia glandulosa HHB12029]